MGVFPVILCLTYWFSFLPQRYWLINEARGDCDSKQHTDCLKSYTKLSDTKCIPIRKNPRRRPYLSRRPWPRDSRSRNMFEGKHAFI